MIHLAKMLSSVPPDAYRGAMIARLTWTRNAAGEARRGVHIVRDTQRILSLCAVELGELQGRLVIELLRQASKARAKTEGGIQGAADDRRGVSIGELRFTRADIADFLAVTGDQNPIHRTEQPVVPGMLILHRFLEAHIGVTGLQMKFYAPLYTDECVSLVRHDGMVDGIVNHHRRFLIDRIEGRI